MKRVRFGLDFAAADDLKKFLSILLSQCFPTTPERIFALDRSKGWEWWNFGTVLIFIRTGNGPSVYPSPATPNVRGRDVKDDFRAVLRLNNMTALAGVWKLSEFIGLISVVVPFRIWNEEVFEKATNGCFWNVIMIMICVKPCLLLSLCLKR